MQARYRSRHIIFDMDRDICIVFNELLKPGVIIRPAGGINPNTRLRIRGLHEPPSPVPLGR